MPICAESRAPRRLGLRRQRRAAGRGDDQQAGRARARPRRAAAPRATRRGSPHAKSTVQHRLEASASTEVSAAGSRGSEIEISSQPSACELQREQRSASPRPASRGVQSRSPIDEADRDRTPSAGDERRVEERPGRPAHVAALPCAQREQEARVGERGQDPVRDAERRGSCRRRRSRARPRSGARRRGRPGSRRASGSTAARRRISHASRPTNTTCRLPSTRREPGADLLDRLVPGDEVDREEDAGQPRRAARCLSGPRPEAPVLEPGERPERPAAPAAQR